MPQFSPGEAKTAVAPIIVKPSGLSCEVEIFLGPDDMTKVATSGRIPFSSTGVSQDIRLPVVMPAAEGAYHVYIDVYAEGFLIAAYQAVEDVVISTPAPPSGEILGITWSQDGGITWHPFTEPISQYYETIQRNRILNTGNMAGTFKLGQYHGGLYPYWSYSPAVDIDVGEGFIDWVIGPATPGVWETTFHLFANDTEVDSVTVTITVV